MYNFKPESEPNLDAKTVAAAAFAAGSGSYLYMYIITGIIVNNLKAAVNIYHQKLLSSNEI
jgi:hypothetical protein